MNIDTNAKLVTVHTPIPVLLHWQKEVKVGLDRDVRFKSARATEWFFVVKRMTNSDEQLICNPSMSITP